MITVIVNGTPQHIEAHTTLFLALEQWEYENTALAVAVNHTFVPREQHNKVILKEGDKIEIVAPMEGG